MSTTRQSRLEQYFEPIPVSTTRNDRNRQSTSTSTSRDSYYVKQTHNQHSGHQTYHSPSSHTTASHTSNTHRSSHSRRSISSHSRQGISRHFKRTPPRVPSRVSPVPVNTDKQHKHTTHIEIPHEVSLSQVLSESFSISMTKLRSKGKFTFNLPTHL